MAEQLVWCAQGSESNSQLRKEGRGGRETKKEGEGGREEGKKEITIKERREARKK